MAEDGVAEGLLDPGVRAAINDQSGGAGADALDYTQALKKKNNNNKI